MRARQKEGLGLVLAVMAAAVPAAGQVATEQPAREQKAGSQVLLGVTRMDSMQATLPGRLLRVIEDANLGDRWLLVRDGKHPGGPARLVLDTEARRERLRRAPAVAPGEADLTAPPLPAPLIRTGDRLVVEENTPVVEARLEAVALGPAWAGSKLNVRLEIGGRVVRAVALAPGRAALQPEAVGRP
jgi:hypothetical protein